MPCKLFGDDLLKEGSWDVVPNVAMARRRAKCFICTIVVMASLLDAF